MSDVKISDLPVWGGTSAIGSIPITILGQTYQITPSSLITHSSGGGSAITGGLNKQYTYSGSQTFILPDNSLVVNVTLNYAIISDWSVAGNVLTVSKILESNDEINVYGFISTSSTIDDYKQTFIYNGGSQSFTIPASTYISIITYNGAPISDYTVAGTTVTIGTSITLVSLDEIVIYGITL